MVTVNSSVTQGRGVVDQCFGVDHLRDDALRSTPRANDRRRGADSAKSASMLEALLIVQETVEQTNIRVHGHNIESEANKVADLPGRGRTGDAFIEASNYFGFDAETPARPIDFTDIFDRLAQSGDRGACE